jgi:hypothetical protein
LPGTLEIGFFGQFFKAAPLERGIDKRQACGNRCGAGGVGTGLEGRRDIAVVLNKGTIMKKISFALVGAASLALSACGGKGDDSLGENVQENYENAADNLDAAAGNATGTEADALGNQADALRDEGARKEEAIDDADVNASNPNAVNAM